ncbi:peptidoglycan editing factor PgeF [Orbaceae bacterium ESL0721]|nr:peptidoglycan editing factor PgeF [Orbaceae bacterium ESL0721]
MIYPNWPAPQNIHAFTTTRQGGSSLPPFDTLNMGSQTGDTAVAKNRLQVINEEKLPSEPYWLLQTHSTIVKDISEAQKQRPIGSIKPYIEADGSYTNQANQVSVVLTADCLPVLFCSKSGDEVAAAHAGWRGLCHGILEETVAKFRSSDLLVWLGPAIGPTKFEVGEEVRAQFIDVNPKAKMAFKLLNSVNKLSEKKYLADLYLLAKQRLNKVGVTEVYGGDYCTYSDPKRFYSYRYNPQTGRMASMIWFE